MRKRNNRGFTMAELLIVVAIISVLAGVGFVAVQKHQRSLAQLERNTVAKEIYFAAQNHLTMAESQGLLKEAVEESFYGNAEGADDIYYVIADGGASFNDATILDLMLPFGAIDETVRTGGFYIIRYQANPAIVLDVFYCSKRGEPDKYNYKGGDTYSTFLGYRNNLPGDGYVVGWYGGATPGKAGTYLVTPYVTVSNEEKLTVTVTDPNSGNGSLKLIVKGVSSGAQAAFVLDATKNHNHRVTPESGQYKVVLDDITKHGTENQGWHFADLNDESLRGFETEIQVTGSFTPGEDIVVVAMSYNNDALMNIAYSNEVTTNSLFADLINETTEEKDPDTGEYITRSTAVISCIRHLENLDKSLSGWDVDDLTDARQVADLNWSAFAGVEGKVSVCKKGDIEYGTNEGCYLPVNPGVALTYDGNRHTISNIAVDTTATVEPSAHLLEINAGGIFGTLNTGSCVKNLEIRDIKVTLASGSAGALVGTLTQDTEKPLAAGQFNVSNVVAYNTREDKYNTAIISTASGNAGGLIGEAVGACKIEKSAAAVGVSSASGNAGGLIGASDGGAVNGCYSGGHTVKDARTGSDAVVYDPAKPNVKAEAKADGTAGAAGGLIGAAGGTTIGNSYSTCSAEGVTAGGLVRTATGSIVNCYATGLVNGTAHAGAFAGTYSPGPEAECRDCRYFEIINEHWSDSAGYTYLDAVGGGSYTGTMTALDETAAAFNDAFSPANWQDAVPYLEALKVYYGEGTGEARAAKYILKTVKQLGVDVAEGDYVATHYGDWPAPEIFVINAQNA